MRFVTMVKGLWPVCILAVMMVTDLSAQTSTQATVGEPYTLAVIAVPGDTYEWTIYTDYTLTVQATTDEVIWLSPNTGPTVSVQWKKSGLYYFTVMAVNPRGCMNLKVGLVIVNESESLTPAIAIYPDKNPICKGTLVTFNAIAVNEGKDPIYRWTRNGNPVGKNSSRYLDNALGTNDVIVCRLTSSAKFANPLNVTSNKVTMIVHNTIAAFSVEESINQRNWQLQLINRSVDADTYKWDFGNGETSVEENPVVIYRYDSTYKIRLISSNRYRCTDTAYYKYIMLFRGLYIPNAFAPASGVSIANLFKPAGINLKEYKIEVYDSWGHLLWESDKLDESGSPVEAWDGTYKGSLMPQGTYMWKVNAVFKDGTIWTGSDIGHGKGKNIGTVALIR